MMLQVVVVGLGVRGCFEKSPPLHDADARVIVRAWRSNLESFIYSLPVPRLFSSWEVPIQVEKPGRHLMICQPVLNR